MCFIFSLIPATIFVVIGYFVLMSSGKAEEGVRKFGRFLAIWVFIIASFFPICGAYMTLQESAPWGT
jgi:Mn2+/Fe2+ NRAMP family transporter